jgi:hypothetical protein
MTSSTSRFANGPVSPLACQKPRPSAQRRNSRPPSCSPSTAPPLWPRILDVKSSPQDEDWRPKRLRELSVPSLRSTSWISLRGSCGIVMLQCQPWDRLRRCLIIIGFAMIWQGMRRRLSVSRLDGDKLCLKCTLSLLYSRHRLISLCCWICLGLPMCIDEILF